jgi:rhodanese-related sulfurtransferase
MTDSAEHTYELTPDQLADRVAANPGLRLIDVREPVEWGICRIAGAELIPMNDIPARMVELAHDEEIIFYCHHGTRSAQVLNYLYQQGYRNIAHLAGGINAWAQERDPEMPTY